MNHTVTITSKNQITLPAKLIRRLNLKQGDKLIVKKENNSITLRPEKSIVDELSGSLKTDIILSDEELEQAIEDSITAEYGSYDPLVELVQDIPRISSRKSTKKPIKKIRKKQK